MSRWRPSLLTAAVIIAAVVIAGCGAGRGGTAGSRATATTATSTRTASAGTRTGTGTHTGPGMRTGPSTRTGTAATGHHARHELLESRVGWHRYTGPVPILVYHDLGVAPTSEPWPGLYMRYPVFREEMRWLHRHGYEAVTLDQLMDGWYHRGLLPRKPIVITFDNGYPPQVTFAPRVMGRYRWPGVLNEITEHHLSDGQIRHVLRLGWEVDSHSLTHPDLTTLTPAELRAQVAGSRRFLRRTFHIPVNSFCYPSSRYNAAVVAAVKAAGYTNAVTEGDAYATRADPYLLPRFEMTAGLAQLIADLAEPH